jgi:hypothetical protein
MLSKSLVIVGYKEPPTGTVTTMADVASRIASNIINLIGTYTLQLNPDQISFTTDITKQGDDDSDINASILTSKAPPFLKKTLGFDFIIDNTGAVPQTPDGTLGTLTLAQSIALLEKVTITPHASTHRPPFVWVMWGMGNISIFGIVKSFKYDYTFFDAFGIPLRAKVAISIDSVDNSQNSLFQSPDITKMPVVKDGDNIVKLSEGYYDNKKYYLKLAEFNNLSSIRALKKGSQIEVPPLRK